MNDHDDTSPAKREYPPFYEKAVPIVLGVIVVVIVILLFIILGIALGLFSGSA